MYLLDAAGGANLFGTGPQGRWQGKRLGLQGTGAGVNTTGFGQPKCPWADTSKHGPICTCQLSKGADALPRGSGGHSHGQWGSSSGVPHPSPPENRGLAGGWWRVPKTNLPQSWTKLSNVTKKRLLQQGLGRCSDSVMVNLLFSVLCNLGVVNVKAAGLIFSSCIMLEYFFFFTQALSRKRKAGLLFTDLFNSHKWGERQALGPQTRGMGSSLIPHFY